jgi:hypothetical protein
LEEMLVFLKPTALPWDRGTADFTARVAGFHPITPAFEDNPKADPSGPEPPWRLGDEMHAKHGGGDEQYSDREDNGHSPRREYLHSRNILS